MSLLSTFDMKFTGITADSRKVQPGALFLAYPGVHADGRDYIAQAIDAGAAAVAWESRDFTWNRQWQIANAGVAGLKNQVGEIAAEYYGQPSQQLHMIGVTGTNGKTSVSQWLAQALAAIGQKTAVIGTIGNGFLEAQNVASNTTPDAILLQAMLADFAAQGAKAVAMEVSSHGLHQGRVNGVHFDLAVLTNLSRDHLDYHETMEAYAAAKAELFNWPGLGAAVLNADDAFGQRLLAQLKAKNHQSGNMAVLSYGLHAGDVRATDLQLHEHGLTMQVATPQGSVQVNAPVLGRFNAYNVLAVLASLLALKTSLPDAVAAIAQIRPVAGRIQQFGGEDKPLVVVDYAHTPDALEKVLATLREQVRGKLTCVFGCGGDRDAGKRPLMGAVASRFADSVIVTSDNPRSEDPNSIIAQITRDMTGSYVVETDRATAIKHAVLNAQSGDIVLIAGKGHEDYQEIAGVKMPFSDTAEVCAALEQYQAKAVNMMQLSEAAAAVNAMLLGADVRFDSVGTDSRSIAAGQLFVALKGENFDGNAFAAEAINKGAAAVMVSDAATMARPALLVKDSRLALGALAKYWRDKFNAPVIGVTGSNGKTTTKEMLMSILAAATGDANKVHATYGNLNNDIGLPLTLLKIRPQHQYVVAEMGMNHLGEIDYLTRIASPNVAVINNANTAHIGELGSRENIARAKGEIFSGLQQGGVAVINADNDFADYWKTLNVGRKIVTFGLQHKADISASYREHEGYSEVTLTTPNGQVGFELKVEGVHNISNALAASAAAYALGISNADIAKGLQNFGGVYGRLQRKVAINGAALIDDTYNANPDSMKAAIDVLAKHTGKKILVLGDMGELGADASEMHAEIGAYAKAASLDELYCLGEMSREMVAAFGAGAMHFDAPEAVAAAVIRQLDNNTTVLVKGSRFMRMERVVSLLAAKQQSDV